MTMKKYDYTTLSTLQRCEQEYVWRHVRHLSGTALNASAHFGQMLHVGVRALYDGKSVVEAQAMLLEAWRSSTAGLGMAGAMGATGVWGCADCGVGWEGERSAHPRRLGTIAPSVYRPATACDNASTLPVLDAKKAGYLKPAQATALLAGYAVAYLGTQPYECVWNEGYGESATESALPDRAVRDVAGKLWAMDLKTTAMYISSTWERSFEHSQQVAIQLDVLEAELGEHVEGFVLDAVQVRAGVSAQSFVRYGPVGYSDALRAELREQRAKLAVRANELAKLPQAALKTPSACVRYNSLCPYFDLCRVDPVDREPLVQIALQRGRMEEIAWDPRIRDSE